MFSLPTLRRRLLATGAALLAILGVGVITALPASAAYSDYGCSSITAYTAQASWGRATLFHPTDLEQRVKFPPAGVDGPAVNRCGNTVGYSLTSLIAGDRVSAYTADTVNGGWANGDSAYGASGNLLYELNAGPSRQATADSSTQNVSRGVAIARTNTAGSTDRAARIRLWGIRVYYIDDSILRNYFTICDGSKNRQSGVPDCVVG